MKKSTDYCIIGSGRLAKHFQYYLTELGAKYTTWSRSDPNCAPLERLVPNARVALLAVSDSAVPVIAQRIEALNGQAVHFSGSLELDQVPGFHPLMTFSGNLYTHSVYAQMPFVSTVEKTMFLDLLPHFSKNPFYTIKPELKALYHSLCVLTNNYATLLWSATAKEMKTRLNLPACIFDRIIEQTAMQWVRAKGAALTGPLVRNDSQTIESHLVALEGTPLYSTYQAFLELYNMKD